MWADKVYSNFKVCDNDNVLQWMINPGRSIGLPLCSSTDPILYNMATFKSYKNKIKSSPLVRPYLDALDHLKTIFCHSHLTCFGMWSHAMRATLFMISLSILWLWRLLKLSFNKSGCDLMYLKPFLDNSQTTVGDSSWFRTLTYIVNCL